MADFGITTLAAFRHLSTATTLVMLVACSSSGDRDESNDQLPVGQIPVVNGDVVGEVDINGDPDAVTPKDKESFGDPDADIPPQDTCATGLIHTPCDSDNDILHAMGLGCPGEVEINATIIGAPSSASVGSKLGNTNAFDPTEGQKWVVLGSGFTEELYNAAPPNDPVDTSATYCNDTLFEDTHDIIDPGQTLPAPINPMMAGDCVADPSLVGTGDCSNTLEEQWEAAATGQLAPDRAFNYSEIRFTVTVPEGVHSIGYDFAFFSTEYPYYYGAAWNDIYIGWLESESWTGNISFDEEGHPISLNAGFLDYRDVPTGDGFGFGEDDCTGQPDKCIAPELHGTCMEGHAGSKWLTTEVGVTPGEEITLIFAMMDLGDGQLDSYVLLDNFRWGCDPKATPKPTTHVL